MAMMAMNDNKKYKITLKVQAKVKQMVKNGIKCKTFNGIKW